MYTVYRHVQCMYLISIGVLTITDLDKATEFGGSLPVGCRCMLMKKGREGRHSVWIDTQTYIYIHLCTIMISIYMWYAVDLPNLDKGSVLLGGTVLRIAFGKGSAISVYKCIIRDMIGHVGAVSTASM